MNLIILAPGMPGVLGGLLSVLAVWLATPEVISLVYFPLPFLLPIFLIREEKMHVMLSVVLRARSGKKTTLSCQKSLFWQNNSQINAVF